MTGLLRAEVRRITSRRMVRVFALIVLLVTAFVLVKAFADSHRDSAAVLEQRRTEQIDDYVRQCEEFSSQDPNFPAEQCSRENFEGAPSGDRRLFASRELGNGVTAVAVGLAIVGFVVGASFVGAEWGAGTMQALLFWETRRGRVLVAKALALVVVMVAFTLLLQALVYGATSLTASVRGSTEGVTAGLHTSNLLRALRGCAFVSASSLIGFAIAGLARHTVASLGIAFGYFVILENLMRGFRPGWQRFLLVENFHALMEKKTQVAPAGTRRFVDLVGEQQLFTLTGVRAAVTLALYLAILLAGFYLSFTRRDVT